MGSVLSTTELSGRLSDQLEDRSSELLLEKPLLPDIELLMESRWLAEKSWLT